MDEAHEQVNDCSFTFIDLFAGIGGMRLGLEAAGGKCVYSCERDKWARKTYEANFGHCDGVDVWDELDKLRADRLAIPDHDLLAAGFPCQPFSLAGVSKKRSLGKPDGFNDQNQGRLFFAVEEIVRVKRPKVVLLENVRNLVSHDGGRTLRSILQRLDDLKYRYDYRLLNARAWVPQNRIRLFLVAVRDEPFSLDSVTVPEEPYPVVREILEPDVDPKYTITDRLWEYLPAYAERHRRLGNGFGYSLADLDGATRTLSARYHKDGAEILIHQDGQNPRRLTPVECRRLMGFPEDFQIVVSNTQAYRQFGNAVVVKVVKSIGQHIVRNAFAHSGTGCRDATVVSPPCHAVVRDERSRLRVAAHVRPLPDPVGRNDGSAHRRAPGGASVEAGCRTMP